MKLCKFVLRGLVAIGFFLCSMMQTAAADFVAPVDKLPTVIANDSSQTIVKLLVRDRENDFSYIEFGGKVVLKEWDVIEKEATCWPNREVVRNITSGQWAQYNLIQESRVLNSNGQRLIDVQVTLADGRVLELGKIDICTKDIVLTDTGLMTVNAFKTPSPEPDIVQAGSYFHNHQPQGFKAAESQQ